MLLREVAYARPRSVADALRLLAEDEGARPLAGGQSLINVLKTRLASPRLLVDLGALEELREIRRTPDGGLAVGAMATLAELMLSPDVAAACPVVGEVVQRIADTQVRNRGTIGGNLCFNVPGNHLPPLVTALGATLTVAGRDGEREVAADDFFRGVSSTAVGRGELLVRVTIPPRDGAGDAFEALALGVDGQSLAAVAASVRGNGTLTDVRVVAGCVGVTPVRLLKFEQALAGSDGDEAAVAAAARGVGASLDEPPGDAHATGAYRRHLTEVLAGRAVISAIRRKGGRA
jgi:carbon-monoxide dehydrogenase medium subunit